MTYSERTRDILEWEKYFKFHEYFLKGVKIHAFTTMINGNPTVIAIEVRRRDSGGIEEIHHNGIDYPEHIHTLRGERTVTDVLDLRLKRVLDFIFQKAEAALDDKGYGVFNFKFQEA